MTADHGDDDDDREFTASERRALRKLIESGERSEWLRSNVRRWMGWVAGAVIFTFAASEGAQKMLGWLTKKVGP
jgi:hypothetical protein